MVIYTYKNSSSVYIDRITNGYFMSVNTDKSRYGSFFVDKNYRRKNPVDNSVCFHRFFGGDTKLPPSFFVCVEGYYL